MQPVTIVLLVLFCLFVTCETKRSRTIRDDSDEVDDDDLWRAALLEDIRNELAVQQAASNAFLTGQLATVQSDIEASIAALSEPVLPRDCLDIYNSGNTTTGQHMIYPENTDGFVVYCDMDTTSGGWTVIQRRVSNSSFYRDWSEYTVGFGDFETNFWLGLGQINKITSQSVYTLRLDMTNTGGTTAFATYTSFAVADAASNYSLSVCGYSGDAGDSLRYHNGMEFTTKDRDNDNRPTENCAVQFTGAWWYNDCFSNNLNGVYTGGLLWGPFPQNPFLTAVDMKVKRLSLG